MAKKDRSITYILIASLIAALILGYYLPAKHPESGITMTPQESMEVQEMKRLQREKYAEDEAAPQEPNQARAESGAVQTRGD